MTATSRLVRWGVVDELDEIESALPIPHDVMIIDVEETVGDKYAWWCPGSRVITLKRSLSRPERRFALAHEAAHIVLGHVGAAGGPNRQAETMCQEREADELAFLLLLHAVAAPAAERSPAAAR